MSATIEAYNSKFVIFGCGNDDTLSDSGDGKRGEKFFFSHPYVPLGSVNYAGQYYFLVPDNEGNIIDAVKDDIAHCTFTPALGSTFDTEGELTIKVEYYRQYVNGNHTFTVRREYTQTIEVVDHGTIDRTITNMDIYTDGYGFIRPEDVNVVEVTYYALDSGNYTKVSSIPWRATELGHSIYPFLQSSVLTDISELEFADTSNCTRFKDLFHNADVTDFSAIKDWDTSNVTEFVNIFWATNITDLTALENWDVSNATSLAGCFHYNLHLTSLHGLENWDVSNVTDMNGLVFECTALTDISALAEWNTSSLTDLGGAFRGCYALESLHGLENWDVSNVTDLQGTFQNCRKITNLEPLANWNPKPTSLRVLCEGCYELTSLDGVENFDLSDCTSVFCAFRSCNKLIDISAVASWDVSNVTDFRQMFEWSHWINDVSAISGWTFGECETKNMFGYVAACLNVDNLDLDLSNCTSIAGMFATRKYGRIDETGELAYEESDYYWTYDGESYSRLAYNLTPFVKDASHAQTWTVSGTDLGAFDSWWSNTPTWN